MSKQSSIKTLTSKLELHDQKIKKLLEDTKIREGRPTLKIGKHEVTMKKCINNPLFTCKTVLTDSTWTYVDIFLKKNGASEALFYWQQAQNFFEATLSLSLVSKPLTTYYCFLNATKALLVAKGVAFDIKHGVTGSCLNGTTSLQNEAIMFKNKGILSSLCSYLGEPIMPNEQYSLKQILYNLQFIHRAYTLTYPNEPEMFIPILNPRFVFDKDRKVGWLEVQLEREHSNKMVLNKLVGFSVDRRYDNSDQYTIRRNKTFHWETSHNQPTQKSLEALNSYYQKTRKQLRYIYSASSLWYIKRTNLQKSLERSTLPLVFAAMHRLSELSRYNPQTLNRHFEKNHNWLLTEFINKSLYQFVDQISSEITGNDFRMTGFRA